MAKTTPELIPIASSMFIPAPRGMKPGPLPIGRPRKIPIKKVKNVNNGIKK